MPNPTQSDLHINAPLTQVSVAYIQESSDYIAHRIFPKLPVNHQTDVFWKYSKSDWRRRERNLKRAPATESKGGGWKMDTDTYRCDVYAFHKDIDDQTRANADSNFSIDSDATRFVTNQLMLGRDIDWCDTFFSTGIWDTEKTGVASSPSGDQFIQWSDDASDPIGDITSWALDFRQLTGKKPRILVLGAQVLVTLMNHPDILDRIKYTQKGVVTEDLLAELFGIPQVVTAYATWTDVDEELDARAQDADASYEFIADPKAAAFYYTPPSPSLQEPSAGYTFTWKGYQGKGNAEGITVDRFRLRRTKVDRVEAEVTYDMKVVSPDCGVFIADAVA